MSIDIFIRTYHKDLEFLKYSLRSIQKFVSGYNKIIICIPEGEEHLLADWNLTQETIIPWKPLCANGYIDQQLNKLEAYCFCNADHILYVDSDVIFFEKTDLSEYFIDGKPLLLKTHYSKVGEAICWKKPTEEILGLAFEYEYMRRIPLLYRRDTLIGLAEKINIDELAKRDSLSEFNLIGAYIEAFEPDNYTIIDTDSLSWPANRAKQFWSWGGITGEVKKEIETFLK